MLAAYCPQCGAPNPVSLATPDALLCSHCHYRGSPKPEVVAELQRAAQTVGSMDARQRQLSGLQRRSLRSKSAGCLYLAVLGLFTLGFAFMGVSCATQEQTPPTWFLVLGWVPVLVMLISGSLGGTWIRREQRRLEEACAAVPPRAPGEPARCHLCGAPLNAVAGQAIARCDFCQTDNVVSSSALERARAQQSQVVTSFETAVRTRADRVLTTSVLAKFMLVGMAIVAPILTIVISAAVGIILYQYEGPADDSVTYATWKTGDGLCLAQVHKSSKGGITLHFGTNPVRGVEPEQRIPSSAKIERLKATELIGRQAFAWGGAGKIKRVYTTLIDEGSNRIEIDVAGEIIELGEIAGVCLVQGDPPKQLVKLDHLNVDELVAVGKRLFWLETDAVRSAPKAGGKVKTVYKSEDYLFRLASDGTHLYFEEASKLARVSLAGSDHKELGRPETAGVLDETRALIAGAEHLFLSTDKGVQRLPKTGGKVALLQQVEDGRGLIVDAGDLYFHSVAQGALFRVRKGEDEAEAVAKGLKLAPEVSLGVDEKRVYFVTADAQLHGWPKSGGAPTKVLELVGPVAAFALHQQKAHWWVDGNFVGVGGGLFSSALDAKVPADNRMQTLNTVESVAVDAQRVYWIDSITQRLMSLGL